MLLIELMPSNLSDYSPKSKGCIEIIINNITEFKLCMTFTLFKHLFFINEYPEQQSIFE